MDRAGSTNFEVREPEISMPARARSASARAAIDLVERALGWWHRHQRVSPGGSPVKVNLGSGLYVAPGWINIDGSIKAALAGCPEPLLRLAYRSLSMPAVGSEEEFIALLKNHVFVHHNLRHGIPLPDYCADFAYSSHVLHHLYYEQAAALLKDVHRILRPGGVARIVVPDLEYIISLYQRGQRQEFLSYFFYSSEVRGQLSTRHYQYDFVLLRDLLASVGFRDVRRCAFRVGQVPDLDALDRMPSESLYVEASA
jgi:SAM-dependent methyltransferase